MAFRTPTPLKSTDLQWGQRIVNTANSTAISHRSHSPWRYRAIFGLLPRAFSERLASLAAPICSRVLRSGSESESRSFARETCRLCRFANLLSIL
jgi:hypothetical protein